MLNQRRSSAQSNRHGASRTTPPRSDGYRNHHNSSNNGHVNRSYSTPPTRTSLDVDLVSRQLMAVPGQTRRRVKQGTTARTRRKRSGPSAPFTPSNQEDNYNDNYNYKSSSMSSSSHAQKTASLFTPGILLAIGLWYSLGIVSISTSKLLLTAPRRDDWTHLRTQHSKHNHNTISVFEYIGGVSPMTLALQQFVLGTTFLRLLLHYSRGWTKGDKHDRIQSWDQIAMLTHRNGTSSLVERIRMICSTPPANQLLRAGVCFSMGFYVTNLGFGAASASFVETVKAAEPITSAALAVSYGLEVLTTMEVSSLCTIVLGVVLSTLGNATSNSTEGNTDTDFSNVKNDDASLFVTSLQSCAIVMLANLCFSFRGLYQKLFRSAQEKRSAKLHQNGGEDVDSLSLPDDTKGHPQHHHHPHHHNGTSTPLKPLDDLNLQFRMQQIGVFLLLPPTVLWKGSGILHEVARVYRLSGGLVSSGLLSHYLLLSLINGLAFTCYNLASTYILSRISVVHHAALNCLRRIVAVVITSILFQVPMTLMGVFGILLSVSGFLVFTWVKQRKNTNSTNPQQQQQHQVPPLRTNRSSTRSTTSPTKTRTNQNPNHRGGSVGDAGV